MEQKNIVPTKEELLELIKFHKMNDIDYGWWCFTTAVYSGSDSRAVFRSIMRIKEIVDLGLVTLEEARKAVDQAYVEYPKLKQIHPDVWNVYMNGPDDVPEALHEKFCADVHGMEEIH
jgi:hypothetical protein